MLYINKNVLFMDMFIEHLGIPGIDTERKRGIDHFGMMVLDNKL